MLKRTLSLMLSVCILLGLCTPVLAASAVDVVIDGNWGTFDISYGSETETGRGDWGLQGEVGKTLADAGIVSITNITYMDPSRQFLGWAQVGEYMETDPETGEQYEQWGPISPVMDTATLLAFPLPASDNGSVHFAAIWDGEDDDYLSDVGFNAMGGALYWMEDTDGDGTPETEIVHDDGGNMGGRTPEGETYSQRSGFTFSKTPTHPEGYTFEGWVMVSDVTRTPVSDTIYTTNEVLNVVPSPEDSITYYVKWDAYDLSFYDFSAAEDIPAVWFLGNFGSVKAVMAQGGDSDEMEGPYIDLSVNADTSIAKVLVQEQITLNLAAEYERHTFTGWTMYEFDEFDNAAVPVGQTYTPDKGVVALYVGAVGEDDDTADVYVLLSEGKYTAKTDLTTEQAFDTTIKTNTLFVAQWQENVVTEVTLPGSSDKHVIEIAPEVKVPQNAGEKNNTPEKVKKNLAEAIVTSETINSEAEVVFMEIELKVQKQDGSWEKVDAQNFPPQGLEVVIPYPEGVDPEDYSFTVAHMLADGEIEILKAKKTDDGLVVKVKSLSPFAVAFAENVVENPDTGDISLLPMTTMLVSALGAAVTFRKKED